MVGKGLLMEAELRNKVQAGRLAYGGNRQKIEIITVGVKEVFSLMTGHRRAFLVDCC